MSEMIMPCSYEAEQAVLGGLMLDNDRWDEVILQISPEDLFSRPHRMVFRVMAELAGEGLPLDLITITERLETRGDLVHCGGFAYLAEMSKNTPSAANILAYAGVVAEKSRLRQLMTVGNSLLSDVQAPKANSAGILESAEGKLFNIAEQGAMQLNSETGVNEALDKVLTQLESMTASDGLTGTPTGFSELDAMTCGLQPGDLALLAARPSMGKTSLAMASCTAAVRGKPDDFVFVFSLEMPAEQLMMRLLAMEGRVELSRLRSGNMGDEDWARVSEATGRIIEWQNRLIIDDTSYQTPATLRARARRYVRKYGRPSLIMLDYLQLVRSPEQENRTQEISEISRSLKALGKELGCGFSEKAEIAAYAFDVLTRQLKDATTSYLRTQNRRLKLATRRARAEQFRDGWVYGVREVISAADLSREELQVMSHWLESRSMKTVTTRELKACRGADTARYQGYEAGQNARLHQGVSGRGPAAIGYRED